MTTEVPTHVAVIGTARDVVAGEFCDVSVTEADENVTGVDDDGNEIIEYLMTDRVTLPAVETTVRAGGDGGDDELAEADTILRDNGYRRVSGWEYSDNAIYANVVIA